jgi:hypothetical protein
MRQILAARVIPEICCPQGSKQPRWSSVSPSWIDPAAIRVNKTESRSEACLNRLLQQNLPATDMTERRLDVLIAGTVHGRSGPRKR